jgi:hypothetical protein
MSKELWNELRSSLSVKEFWKSSVGPTSKRGVNRALPVSDICYRKEHYFKSETTFFQIFHVKTPLKVTSCFLQLGFTPRTFLSLQLVSSTWTVLNRSDIQTGSQPCFSRLNVLGLKLGKMTSVFLFPVIVTDDCNHMDDLELESLRRWCQIVSRPVVRLGLGHTINLTYYQCRGTGSSCQKPNTDIRHNPSVTSEG